MEWIKTTGKISLILLALCLSTHAQSAAGQNPPEAQAAKPAVKPDLPPDEKAYTEALQAQSVSKKMELLEQFLAQYPKSNFVRPAQLLVLDTLIRHETGQKKKIMDRAKKVVEGTRGIERMRTCNLVASAMVNSGVYLKDAAKYAHKSLKASSPQKYLAEQKADYLKRKQTAPPDSELLKRYRIAISAGKATLGRIHYKQKKYEKAEAIFREAYADNENLEGQAILAFAQLMERKGQKEEAYQLALKPVLRGQAIPDLRRFFESLYRQKNNGSMDGLETELDQQYHRLFPNPVKAQPYQPTPSRSRRVVLAELYTGAGCPPCAGAELAFDAALERFSQKEMAFLAYHLHIPRPDPMTNPDTVSRKDELQVRGTPTWFIDGKRDNGGGPREDSPQIFEKKLRGAIEERLQAPAQAELKLQVSRDGQIVKVNCQVEEIQDRTPDLKLRIALTENHIRYTGENGVRFHSMAVRSLVSFSLENGPSSRLEHRFDLKKISTALNEYLDHFENNSERFGKFSFLEKKHLMDPNHLGVVAFLEDTKTKNILQAVRFDLSPAKEGPVDE